MDMIYGVFGKFINGKTLPTMEVATCSFKKNMYYYDDFTEKM